MIGTYEVIWRLLAAAVFGGVIGVNRSRLDWAAGMRTHMLVTLGAALFVMAMSEGGAGDDAISRVIQGIAAGIGFLCAGTILKQDSADTARVKGLTTAAGLWLSTAIGICVGRGHSATAVLGTLLALLVLHSLPRLFERPRAPRKTAEDHHVP